MKVLDVDGLQTGIQATITDIEEKQRQVEVIQHAVRDFYSLEEEFKGQGGDVIRGFYRDTHEPFLLFLQQSLTDYKQALKEISEVTNSFEGNPNGYVSQAFLEGEVTDGFDKVGRKAQAFADDTNQILDSVRQLVTTPRIDESKVMDSVNEGKRKAHEVIERLGELDRFGASRLEGSFDNLQTMKSFLSEMSSQFTDSASISNYSVKSTSDMTAYQTIKADIDENTSMDRYNSLKDLYSKLSSSESFVYISKTVLSLAKIKASRMMTINSSKKGELDLKEYLLKGDITNDEYSPENYVFPKTGEPTFEDRRKVMGGSSNLAGRPDGLAAFAKFGFDVTTGVGKGAYNIVGDTFTGIASMAMHPIVMASSLVDAALHPIDTSKMLADVVSTSFERDMVNGDAESRASWVTYAIGSIVGTKGATSAAKVGSAAIKSTNIKMPNLFPQASKYQLATDGPVPYNVVNGVNLRDQLITKFSKHFTDSKRTKLIPNNTYRAGEYQYFYKTDNFGRVKAFSTDNLQLTKREKRLTHNPNTLGKKAGDHAGHLAGDRFGGSSDLDNLVSQLSNVNLSKYKIIENQWATAIKQGENVKVNVNIHYDGANVRPSKFEIKYYIDGESHKRLIPN